MKPGTGGSDVLRLAGRLLLALLLWLPLLPSPALTQDALSPRLQIGIGILPAVVAANKRLAADASPVLPVYLVYNNNRHLAEQLKPELEKVDRIQRHLLEVQGIALTELLERELEPSAVIFIVEPLGANLPRLIEFVERRKVLLFSPFEGDVERGVAAGFRVTDKVLPLVNVTALKQSNIHLKAFFLRVAVKHE